MTDHALRPLVATLAAVAAAVAAYLAYARYSGTPITCTSGGCETVQSSEYATLAGIPVALLGVLAYSLIFATALSAKEVARTLGAALAVAAFIFSVFLVYVQLGPIGAVCDWCLANDVLAALLMPLAALRLR